jgi:hypothetical protein
MTSPTLFTMAIRSIKQLARQQARETLSIDTQIRAVYRDERRRFGKAQTKNVRVVK